MNNFRTIIFVATKHLSVRLRQSLAAVLAVAMGSMILVVTLAMMEGLLHDFREKLLEASPPVSIEAPPPGGPVPLTEAKVLDLVRAGAPTERDYISKYPELEAVIESVEGVSEAAPRACSPVIIRHGTRSQRSLVCGIDAASERSVTRLWRWMEEGEMSDLGATAGGIILGDILARRLAASVGSMLRLTSSGGEVMDYRVVGIYASGITKIDESQSFVRLGEGRRLAGIGAGSVTSIGVGVVELGISERVARDVSRMTGLEALTWEEANASAIAAFRMMGVSTYLLVIFTAVVGGFGILNIMVTIVMEKVKDIAILRSMGYTARQVLSIFFMEALVLGATGGVLGCAAGYLLSVFIMSIPYQSTEASSVQRDQFTMLLEPSFFIMAFTISLAISIIAGIGPARRAARIDPVEVLRGER